jgi:ketosteroid isomerase-like protein/carbon monoxide dehydrogenase subunit G
MRDVQHISISIARPPHEVYAFASDPRNLPKWASGLARSTLARDGDAWIAEGPVGKVKVRFAAPNAFGVMDHDVELESGVVMHNPMRVVANGAGSELSFTLLRQPGMSDAQLAEDRQTIERDLAVLKSLLERSGGRLEDEPPVAWVQRFAKYLDAGDLEAVVDLYETDAQLVNAAGEILAGRDAIRGVLADLIRSRTRLRGRVQREVCIGDLALLYTDWEGGGTGSRAIELLRRQPDRTWRLIVGDPHGRDSSVSE